jgi:hypothetical protein
MLRIVLSFTSTWHDFPISFAVPCCPVSNYSTVFGRWFTSFLLDCTVSLQVLFCIVLSAYMFFTVLCLCNLQFPAFFSCQLKSSLLYCLVSLQVPCRNIFIIYSSLLYCPVNLQVSCCIVLSAYKFPAVISCQFTAPCCIFLSVYKFCSVFSC